MPKVFFGAPRAIFEAGKAFFLEKKSFFCGVKLFFWDREVSYGAKSFLGMPTVFFPALIFFCRGVKVCKGAQKVFVLG